MKKLKQTFYILLFLVGTTFSQSDTLRIASYNLLKFPDTNYESRLPHLKKVVQAINPDIFVVQEIVFRQAIGIILNDVLSYTGRPMFAAVPFVDGPDTDNALFYRQDKFDFVKSEQISTDLRDISEFTLRYIGSAVSPEIKVYSAHLKASSGSTNEQKRLKETTILRQRLNDLPFNSPFFVVGDMNLYSSSEPAFQMLTGSQQDNDGRCFDPINQIGNWHENSSYSRYHTQSTRTTTFGDGSSGGLDDRFDFIFISEALQDSSAFRYLSGSYTAFGNDGLHFNYNVNDARNKAVPDSIADALYYASDHLPVYLDFVYSSPTRVSLPNKGDFYNDLMPNYPNPFNAQTSIRFSIAKQSDVTLKIFNYLGKEVATLVQDQLTAGAYQVIWNAEHVSSGIYFCRLEASDFMKTQRLILLK